MSVWAGLSCGLRANTGKMVLTVGGIFTADVVEEAEFRGGQGRRAHCEGSAGVCCGGDGSHGDGGCWVCGRDGSRDGGGCQVVRRDSESQGFRGGQFRRFSRRGFSVRRQSPVAKYGFPPQQSPVIPRQIPAVRVFQTSKKPSRRRSSQKFSDRAFGGDKR